MFGRAGRPQFDQEGDAYVLCSPPQQQALVRQLSSQVPYKHTNVLLHSARARTHTHTHTHTLTGAGVPPPALVACGSQLAIEEEDNLGGGRGEESEEEVAGS